MAGAFGDVDLTDAGFDVNFDFDDDGNVVERRSGGARKRKHVPITGPQGATMTAGFAADVEHVTAPAPLVVKITQVVGKLKQYQTRLKRHEVRDATRVATIKKLADQVKQLKSDLQEEREMNDEIAAGRSRKTKLSVVNRRQDDGSRQRARNDARRQLVSGFDMLHDDAGTGDVRKEKFFERTWAAINRWITRHTPLRKDLIQIKARFGRSVASYFSFFRWIILNYIFVALMAMFFLVRHLAAGTFSWTETVNVYLPKFFVQSSYATSEAAEYAGCLLTVNICLTAAALRKWIKEDKTHKVLKKINDDVSSDEDEGEDALSAAEKRADMIRKQRHKKRFAKFLLVAWDHTRLDTQDVKFSIGQTVQLLQHEDDTQLAVSTRSTSQRVKLFLRRLCGILASIVIQAGAGFVIVQLTVTSSELETSIAQTPFAPAAAFIVPISVSILNAMQPPIIIALGKFERWDDPGFQVKSVVWRLFLGKLLNVLLQVMTFSLLADPYLLRGQTYGFGAASVLTARVSAEKKFQYSSFQCRADQAGVGLFQLVLAEFVVGKVLAVMSPYVMMLVARIRKVPFRPAQFDVAKSMVNLLYFTLLTLMSLPLVPFSCLLHGFFLLGNFKFEKWATKKFFVKPVNPWSASDAGAFFVKFYLVSLCVALGASVLVLTNRTFPKRCDLMKTTITSLYGADPYCTHLADINTEIGSLTNQADILRKQVQAGGEISHWLETPSLCQAQCEKVAPAGTNCATRCSEAVGLSLLCDVSNATYANGKILGANVTHPCDLACGPFVDLPSAYTAIENWFLQDGLGFDIVQAVFAAASEPTVLWACALLVGVAGCFKLNSLHVLKEASTDRKLANQHHVNLLQARIIRLKKQLDAYKASEAN